MREKKPGKRALEWARIQKPVPAELCTLLFGSCPVQAYPTKGTQVGVHPTHAFLCKPHAQRNGNPFSIWLIGQSTI